MYIYYIDFDYSILNNIIMDNHQHKVHNLLIFNYIIINMFYFLNNINNYMDNYLNIVLINLIVN